MKMLICDARNGAPERIRTADLVLTKDALCQLSYQGMVEFSLLSQGKWESWGHCCFQLASSTLFKRIFIKQQNPAALLPLPQQGTTPQSALNMRTFATLSLWTHHPCQQNRNTRAKAVSRIAAFATWPTWPRAANIRRAHFPMPRQSPSTRFRTPKAHMRRGRRKPNRCRKHTLSVRE